MFGIFKRGKDAAPEKKQEDEKPKKGFFKRLLDKKETPQDAKLVERDAQTLRQAQGEDKIDPKPVVEKEEPVVVKKEAPVVVVAPAPVVTKKEEPPSPPVPDEGKQNGFFGRLKKGLAQSSNKLTSGLQDIVSKKKLDADAVQELEDLLVQADLGIHTAQKITHNIAKARFDKQVSDAELRAALADEIVEILDPVSVALEIDGTQKPYVILVVGVNGSGKTTTIGKLAKKFKSTGANVVMGAGDTFRAAAVEQLKIWGQRTGCDVIADKEGADSAAVAFDTLTQAKEKNADIVLMDTAGRLHNKKDLMDELAKMIRVMKKIDASAPHACLLILDATTGQNAFAQVKAFKEMVNISGLIVTKLDGSAKGGVVVGLADQFQLPVHAIGVGETVDDLDGFDATDFARSMLDIAA